MQLVNIPLPKHVKKEAEERRETARKQKTAKVLLSSVWSLDFALDRE